MENTTRVFKRQLINTDTATGLDRYAEIIDVIMTGANGGLVKIKGRVALLSPTLKCMFVESEFEFDRFDRAATYKDEVVEVTPATYYIAGEVITEAVLDVDGVTILIPEVIAIGGELKTNAVTEMQSVLDKPANNKFTFLEESPVGQGIKYMLGLDLASGITDGNWNPANLLQN